MNKLAISIVMSVYKPNITGFDRTMQSIFNQTFQDYEVIIIKDDELASTKELIESYVKIDQRVKFIDNNKNIGLIRSLNKGLQASSSELIARIDVDDWWETEKLEKQYKALKEKNLVLIGTQTNLYDSNLNLLNQFTAPSTAHEVTAWFLNGKNPFTHSSVLYKKFAHMLYNEKALYSEDFEMWCRYTFMGKMENLKEHLTNYIVDINSITGSKRYSMLVNSSKVYFEYCNQLRHTDIKQVTLGLNIHPNTSMNFFQIIFSKLYSKGMVLRFSNKKYLSYFLLFSSLIFSPDVFYYYLKRKYFQSKKTFNNGAAACVE